MTQGDLVYEDRPQYAWWLKLMMAVILAGALLLGVVLLWVSVSASVVVFAVTAFDALLFYFVVPRRYRICADRLVIVLGWPFTFSIPLSDIASALRVPGYYALVAWGIRFGTSTHYVVAINRNRKMPVIITPSDGDRFLEHLRRAARQNGEESP